MRARARPLFLRTVFQILFRISQSNGKNENPKTDISALKSVFGFRVRLQIRNPDFKIYIQISQSNAPLELRQNLLRFSKTLDLTLNFKSNEPRSTQNGSKSNNHKSQTMTFGFLRGPLHVRVKL